MPGDQSTDDPETGDESLVERSVKLLVSISVLTLVTVVVGYGGGALLTLIARLGGPDPETDDGDLLRERLLAWPERNREIMRNDGRGELPLTP